MFENRQHSLDDLPQYQDVSFEPLPPKGVLVTLSRRMLPLLVILAALVIVPRVRPEVLLADFGIWPILSLMVLACVLAVLAVLGHRRKGYAVRTHDILYKRGLIRLRQTILPINRIQHLETHRNALEIRLGLSTLKLYSAGGSSADLAIRGLEAATAERIREMILGRIKGERAPDAAKDDGDA